MSRLLSHLSLIAALCASCFTHRKEAVAGPDELVSQGDYPKQQVEVYEDAWGIPHIKAASMEDAAWALGVVHAEERLWQMDLNRRIGHGRLSELMGKRTIDADRFLRGRMLSRSAQEALERLEPEYRELLEAYAGGVNEAIAQMKELPPEYKLLRAKPEPWTPLDSMVWTKVMALNLSGNVGAELLREDVLAKVGPEKADWFLTGYPKDGPRIIPADQVPAPNSAPEPEPATPETESGEEEEAQPAPDADAPEKDPAVAHAGRYAGGRRMVEDLLGPFDEMASNSWVIAGSKTENGKPILANDPHLAVSNPSIWYLCEVETPDVHFAGSSFPGFPGIAIGHNENISWGITTGGLDPQDLFYEEIDGNRIKDGEDWVELEVIEETIEVRRGDPVKMQIRVGPRGPILTEFFDGVKQDVSLRWIAHDPDDTTFQAFLGLVRAKNWDDFRASVALFTSPAHNFVYADKEGHIGWKVAGKVPVRQGRDGRTPARGWEKGDAWQGYVPPAELPEAFDPAQGFIATANNHPVPDDWSRDLGYYNDTSYRARRIVQRLSSADGWTPEKVRALQMNVDSAQVEELLPFLQTLTPSDSRQAEAVELLKGWDGALDADSAAAALYEVWLNEVTDVIARHHLGDELYGRFAGVRGTFLRKVFTGEASSLCVQPGIKDCKQAAEIGLGRALIRLGRTLGDDPADWRWGDLHRLVFHHQLAITRGLRRKLDTDVPAPGDRFTVNVAGYRSSDYVQTWHPSYRQVLTPHDWNESTWIFAPGQSGVSYRAHYRDLVDDYMGGKAVPHLFGETARQKAARVRTFKPR